MTSSTITTHIGHQTLFPQNKFVWISPCLNGMDWVATGLILVYHNMWQLIENRRMDVRSRMQPVGKPSVGKPSTIAGCTTDVQTVPAPLARLTSVDGNWEQQ